MSHSQEIHPECCARLDHLAEALSTKEQRKELYDVALYLIEHSGKAQVRYHPGLTKIADYPALDMVRAIKEHCQNALAHHESLGLCSTHHP